MTVYVLTVTDLDTEIVGVYATVEAAQQVKGKHWGRVEDEPRRRWMGWSRDGDCYIEECEVQGEPRTCVWTATEGGCGRRRLEGGM